MNAFPYFAILKKASNLTRTNLWLWWCGLFWFGLSKGVVIWSAMKFSGKFAKEKPEPVNLAAAWRAGRRFVWPIVGLNFLASILFLALILVLAVPILHLWSAGEIGQTVTLLLMGLGIVLPATAVFGFLLIYGPIFIVVYQANIRGAIFLAFNLLRHKFKESLLLFIFVTSFSIILFSVPVALLGLLFLKLGWAVAALGICVIVILFAGFSVFQNITWVLAVLEMVRMQNSEEKAAAAVPAPEAEPAN